MTQNHVIAEIVNVLKDIVIALLQDFIVKMIVNVMNATINLNMKMNAKRPSKKRKNA